MSKKYILKYHSNNELLMHERPLSERPLSECLLAKLLLAEGPLSELRLLKYLYIFADNQLLMSIPLLSVLSLSVS